MVPLLRMKWPSYEMLVAMVTHRMCLVGKSASKGLFTFLAQCQHLELFPQYFRKKLSSIGM